MALKYGRVIEPDAIENFKQEFGKHHKGVVVSPCGHETPYIGASPDGIVTCPCCPKKKWCLEVKMSSLYQFYSTTFS